MAQRSKKKSFDQTDLKQENHQAHKKHSKTKGLHNGDMHHDMNGGMIIENGCDNGSEHEQDDPLPSEKEVERQFFSMLDNIELSQERIIELKQTSLRHKWNMVKAHDAMQDGKRSVRFYLDQLERHLNPQLYLKNPSKKMLKGIVNVELLLTSLEVDLRSRPNPTWLREFIDEPNCGHIVLLKFLNHVQQCVSSGATTPNGTPRKKIEVLSKDSYDEHLCLLCIKAVAKNKYGFQTMLSAPRSLSIMARSLRLNNSKTRTTVLKLLTQACEQPDGHEKVMKAMDDYKVFNGEKFRFQGLVLSIMTRPSVPAYQQTVLKFLNAVISNAPSSNLRIYYQQEMENAGFNVDTVEETLEGLDSTIVKTELALWREKYIDVATVMDEFVDLRGRTVLLRDEVTLLQSKIEEIEKEKSKVTEEKQDLEARVEDFKLRALELQATVESLKKHQHSTKSSDEVAHALEDAIGDILTEKSPPPPPAPITPPSSLPPAPPPPCGSMPPPPPPPSPFNLMSPPGSIGHSVRGRSQLVKLPMLNWAPIMVAGEKSIFKASSDVSTLENMLDFREFEKKFQLKSVDQDTLQRKRDEAVKKLSSKLNLLSPNKARNLIITKRRIGKNAPVVQDAINHCDIVALPAEHAELLLKFIPTKDELASLAKNAKEYEKFGEAEQFLFQMAKVERYEAKLNVMAYIGLFDELLRGVIPRIESIINASQSIISSKKLHKVFEIILLFGNHMNGSRRGYAQGFKLESLTKLQDTKSNDRSTTFLHYLADMIQSRLPDVDNFYEDFDLEAGTKVSLQMLASDIQSLRKGLDLTKAEKDRQPKNFIIYNFYNRAISKVQRVSERYRKMDEAYKDVCVMFGENPKTKEPSEFFQVFIDFACQYKKAQQDNYNRNRRSESTSQADSVKVRKKVAQEAASVAQNRNSLIEAQMVADPNHVGKIHTNGDLNGNVWKHTNGHAKVNGLT